MNTSFHDFQINLINTHLPFPITQPTSTATKNPSPIATIESPKVTHQKKPQTKSTKKCLRKH